MLIDNNFYLNLITSEHSTKPKFRNWLNILLTPFVDSIKLNEEINKAFFFIFAIGKQLDIIGKWLNQPRQVDFQPTDGSSPLLSDKYYRIILKAKVVKNLWKGTVSDFYEKWKVLFNGEDLQVYLADNQDMDYIIVTWDSTLGDKMIEDLLSNGYLIPKPAGLGILLGGVNPEEVLGFDGSDFQPFNQGVFWPNQ